jgi:hypothetical protein
VEVTQPIYLLTAQEYRRLEDAVVQLAGILDHIYEKEVQEIGFDEDPPLA